MVANRANGGIDFTVLRKGLANLKGLEGLKTSDPPTVKNSRLVENLTDLQNCMEAAGVSSEHFDFKFARDRLGFASDADNLPMLPREKQALTDRRTANTLAIRNAPQALKAALVGEGEKLEKALRKENEKNRKWLQCTQDINNLFQLGIEFVIYFKVKCPKDMVAQCHALMHPKSDMFSGAVLYDRHAAAAAYDPTRPFEKGYELCTRKFESLVLHISLLAELRKLIPLPTAVELQQHLRLINDPKLHLQKNNTFADWLAGYDNKTIVALIGTHAELTLNERVNRVIHSSVKEGANRWGHLFTEITAPDGLLHNIIVQDDAILKAAMIKSMYDKIFTAERHFWQYNAEYKPEPLKQQDLYNPSLAKGEKVIVNSFTKDNLAKKVTAWKIGDNCARCGSKTHMRRQCKISDLQAQIKVDAGEVPVFIPLETVLKEEIAYLKGAKPGQGGGGQNGGNSQGRGGGRSGQGRGGNFKGRGGQGVTRGGNDAAPCWQFEKGNCAFGTNCRFSHSSTAVAKVVDSGAKRPIKLAKVVINAAEQEEESEQEEEIKASSKKPKSSKSSGGVRIITNILEIGSSLKDVLLNAVDASSSIPSDMLACDSGSNEHVANQLRDDVYNVQPIENIQAKMANKSTLSLRATYDTGIKGFGTFYVANNGTMPRSLTSVGRTADEGMMSIFDGENVYILHEGEQIDLKRDQIAYMVPRDKKTGLYMCPYAEFMTPASVKFAQQDRQKKAPACKIPASDPTSDSDGEEA